MFVNEVLKHLDSDFSTLIGELKVNIIGSRAISVQNFKRILNYNSSKIVFVIKNNELIIEGENFKITEMGSKDVIIVGNIKTISFSKE